MPLIGCARVSIEDQDLALHLDALRATGCAEVFEEHASGASRARPQLAAALARLRRGDALVVARIDRLARSLSHLLEVVEALRVRGAHFRSLADPIDTAGPSGVLVLQTLGAVAEFERSLVRERTKAGLVAARARDPATLAKLARSRRDGRVANLLPGLDEWLPVVRRLRPGMPWSEMAEAVNAILPRGRRPFTKERLVRAVRLLAHDGLAKQGCSRRRRAGAPGEVCWHGCGRSRWRRRWWRPGPHDAG